MGFYFTYEELKPEQDVQQTVYEFGFYFTYEELKLIFDNTFDI